MHKHRFQFRVEKMCSVMNVSRSGYYKWVKRKPSEQEKRRQKLKKRIRHHFDGFKQRYGSDKIAEKLREEGWTVSTKTVSRYMKDMGLRSITVKKQKATTNSKHNMAVFENVLNRAFKPDAPNRVWVADITYIATRQGWVYLASIMDLYSRKIVGWSLGERMTKELVLDAFDKAVLHRKPPKGLIHHSDRGSQYASTEYCERLAANEMIGSMSRKGNCYDNACIEAFHSVLKKELIYQTTFKTRKQAYDAIYEYIELEYNRIRIHSSIHYLTPHQFEKRYYEQLQIA
ncbi:IS3 family transposase [Paenibacillus spongiae]|uniref:IS3 family transposase n=1 Tax=Paenibacillus spongiae TaxID=2909671 RepID=A0ABY5SIM1_9BACL|nr:IS3 family transposase [Paenibacillus spongiae]UVI33625.1 IS3 family transposase [Paenibacillus spongiae]UVI33796.1 IS3 family transposase [Paenibacillus spongiae]